MRLSTLACALLAGSFIGITAPMAQEASPQATPNELVDSLNHVFGRHPGYRALYAKGIVVQGRFIPSPTAASVTKAANFQKTVMPLTMRFSDFSGNPDVADSDPLASPHGMAIKFNFPDDSEADIVASSYNGFPAATAGDYLQFLNALAASGPNAPKPTALDKYAAAHPAAAAYLKDQNPPPVSFATESYYGVNSYKFTNAVGDVTYGRYQIVPEAGEHFLAKDASRPADYLIEEIRNRLHDGIVRFKLLLQIADKGDDVANPSIAWPASRKTIELGTIEVDRFLGDTHIAEQAMVFLPTVTPDGIEPADPMIEARGHAYITSFSRRQ